jgi:hypothetical protein
MIKYLRTNHILYYIYSAIAGVLSSFRFRKIHTLVLFIGYPRSGSSTLGSILDAHKNILIAHEFNILEYIQKGYTIRQLFYLLAKNSKQFTRKGRISSGYNGIIKGQFNGKALPCLVIGDKKAGATSRMLENHRELEQMLIHFYPEIKLIHIVRNPYDMIATQAYSGNEKQLKVTENDLSKSIEFNAAKFQTIDRLIKEGAMDIFTIKHESLLSEPDYIITSLITWLKLDVYDGYIEACKAHLFSAPHQSRHEVTWTDEQIKKVNMLISNYNFLEGYSFRS